jgi:hypothetical protein
MKATRHGAEQVRNGDLLVDSGAPATVRFWFGARLESDRCADPEASIATAHTDRLIMAIAIELQIADDDAADPDPTCDTL